MIENNREAKDESNMSRLQRLGRARMARGGFCVVSQAGDPSQGFLPFCHGRSASWRLRPQAGGTLLFVSLFVIIDVRTHILPHRA